ADTGEAARWWRVFGDPALDDLVAFAYRKNPTLEAAGLRVVQAQAGRGVAIGGLWPQRQALSGSYTRSYLSLNTVTPVLNRGFDSFQAGFDAAWEVDLWGRFRRGIEAADADLLAAVADYDDVLVSLVAEVAATYVRIRTIEARLAIARDNVRVQRDSLEIARVRFEAGGTSELDVQQATTLLTDTEATIPELEIQLQQALDALSVLLGLPPSDLTELLGVSTGIPAAPLAVAVGIPADLLRHRPDVRRAERQLAAQSARIGVATSDLLPSIQLAGSVGLSAEDAAKFFQGRSFEAIGGPRFDWPVLNYGRLINNVRVQDAAFEELAALYTDTVLRAQQEVEDSLVGYLRGADQVMFLERSVAAARRAVELSIIQYREGAADYTRVLDTQQAKLQEDDRLLVTRGTVTLSVVALYKALGGGWEIRDGHDFIPEETKAAMRDRTWWGDMLDADEQEADVEAAAAGTEGDEQPGFLRWRVWWPKW
ncbi:MAG: efflux transporter outer membrane subunit, partial [Thermoleophilaceae bacterium]